MTLKAVTCALKKLARGGSRQGVTSDDYFCVEDTFLSKDISITVEGIGKLAFPLSEDTINSLLQISTKAKFGRGEATVLDESVRDTNMVPASKLKVEINEHSLENTFSRIGLGLDIGENSRLVPHLHNLLIYGPGQFFQKHRDSEKTEGMVATMVIVLPYPHEGGDLIIEHGYKKHIFFGSHNPDLVKCVVFYSDCQHEIKTVTEGFRVALTYNVGLESPDGSNRPTTSVDQDLNSAVELYFTSSSHPKRLVYYLNHRYSKRSLRWDLLKGLDRSRALALFEVAKKQGRVPCLALVDYNETYELGDYYVGKDELVSAESNVIFWLDEQNITFEEHCSNLNWVSNCEVCYTKATSEFEPYKTEETGPTGNEGNQRDLWYRRACVVLWSSKIEFSHGFKSILTGLHELVAEKGNEDIILGEIKKMRKDFFKKVLWAEDVINMLFDIVFYVNNRKLAFLVLSKIPQILNPLKVGKFIQIEKQFGSDVLSKVLKQWREYDSGWSGKLRNLSAFIKEYIKTETPDKAANSTTIQNLSTEIIDNFVKTNKLQHSSFNICNMTTSSMQYMYSTTTDDKQINKICELFQICSDLENVASLDCLTNYVKDSPTLFSPLSQAALFSKLKNALTSNQFKRYKALRDYALKSVENHLSQITNTPNDWYLPIKMPCNCKYCSEVQSLFYSRTSKRAVIPAVTANREHVISYLNTFKDLPIKFYTEQNGKPFQLVVEKEPKLFSDRQKVLSALATVKKELEKVDFKEFPSIVTDTTTGQEDKSLEASSAIKYGEIIATDGEAPTKRPKV